MVNVMCDMVWYGQLHASTVRYGALCVWYGVVECICWALIYVRLHCLCGVLSGMVYCMCGMLWHGSLHVLCGVLWYTTCIL